VTSCVVLFSGGLDSTTALAWALRKYDRVHALTFDYGQRHRVEIGLARRAARRLDVPHAVLKVDLRQIGGSALTDPRIPLPRSPRRSRPKQGPPATYVPFRNGIFLALAAAWAEAHGVRDLVCGFHVADSPDYPDTTRAFVKAMEKAVRAGRRPRSGAAPGPRSSSRSLALASRTSSGSASASAPIIPGRSPVTRDRAPLRDVLVLPLPGPAWKAVAGRTPSSPVSERKDSHELDTQGPRQVLGRPLSQGVPGQVREGPRPHLQGRGHDPGPRARPGRDRLRFHRDQEGLTALLPDHTLLNEVFPFNRPRRTWPAIFYGELKRSYPVESVTVWESEDASATYAEDD